MERIFCKMKKQKFSLLGAWPPNLTPYLHDPRDLSRTLRGAHDPEKISEIPRRVAEKIEFKEKLFGAPWRPNRKWAWSRDHMCGKLRKSSILCENMTTLGPEMTTLFAFFEIAFRPTKHVSMGNDEKFCSIRTHPTAENTTTESSTISPPQHCLVVYFRNAAAV